MVDRAAQAGAFLAEAGWGRASRHHLAGDASDRRYERLRLGAATAVFMDNPPGGADDPAAFAFLSGHLRGLGLSAPQVLAADLGLGFLLLEDLGDDLFARLLAHDPAREPELYRAAVEVLLTLQRAPPPPGLPDLSAAEWTAAAELALDAYAASAGATPDPRPFRAALAAALKAHADGPRVLILRDFHAENLLWLPQRAGLARVGLLDFQLGQLGQPVYDLVSLLQDARRDVTAETEAKLLDQFARATGTPLQDLAAAYAVIGAQRALRILGVFVRLCQTRGKPAYLRLVPRVWGQLQRNLAHPALAELRAVCAAALPEPSQDLLSRIERQCPA